MDCYKEFAYIYDELINVDIDYSSFGEFILKICDKNSVHRENYLDLACGTGNLTETIYKNFKHSFGVDMSSEMLTEAERKMRNNPSKPKFICQDICELNINKEFELITCCLDSINYITEESSLEALFISVKKHLSSAGIFVFDINSYHKIKNILGNNTFTYDDADVFYVWENKFEDEIVDMFLTFFIKKGESYYRIDEEHSERAYESEFIIELLKQCGLEIIDILDCQDKPISEETERITFVAKIRE